jgi:hypothetical protein
MPITISAAIAPLRTGVESNEIAYCGASAADTGGAGGRTVFRRSAVISSNPPDHN